MDYEKITKEIRSLAELAGDISSRGGSLSSLERDLALEKLRRLYDFFLDPRCTGESSSDDCAGQPLPEGTSILQGPSSEPAVSATPIPGICNKEESQAGFQADVPPRHPASGPEKRAALYNALYEAPSGQRCEEPLYEPAPQANTASKREAAAVPPVPEAMAEEPSPTIGDSFVREENTISDVYARTNIPDVAEAIAAGNTDSLRKSIGINDKFLLIRDLFEGDADKYEGAMDQFDSFTELEDAMLHIYEHYDWNPNSEGVRLLVELLSRKFS